MAANPTPTQLDMTTDRTPTESTVHCTGKITSDTAELLSGNETNDGFAGFYLVPGLEIVIKHTIQGENDRIFQRGVRLSSSSELPSAAQVFEPSLGQPATSTGKAYFLNVI